MARMSHPAVPFFVLLAALSLAACGGGPGSADNEMETGREPGIRAALDRIEALRREALAPPPVRRIERSRHEAWLDGKLTARYEDIRADHAFEWVAQGTPVEFGFDRTAAPGVRWSPRAGTIRQHLDSIAAQADWSWRYAADRDVLHVRDIETRRFRLSTQPGRTLSRMAVRNLAGAGAEAPTDNTTEIALDPYRDEIRQTVEGILGIGGDAGAGTADPRTRVSLNPSANLLVVTARPNAMREVERVIGPPSDLSYNASAAAIVRFELTILEVEFSSNRERDLLVALIRSSDNLPLEVLLGVTGGLSSHTSESAANAALLGPAASGRHAGSGAVIEWLDGFGETSVRFHNTVEVQNNRAVTVDATRTRRYVSRIAYRVVGDGAGSVTTPEIEFGELRTGIVLHLQPTVLEDGITARIGMSRSSQVGEEPYRFGAVQGVNFVTEDFNSVLSVSLNDGEPKLLSSFSQRETWDSRHTRVPLLGPLGRDRSDRRRETLLLITATRVRGGESR